jgi:hypothetical protein
LPDSPPSSPGNAPLLAVEPQRESRKEGWEQTRRPAGHLGQELKTFLTVEDFIFSSFEYHAWSCFIPFAISFTACSKGSEGWW